MKTLNKEQIRFLQFCQLKGFTTRFEDMQISSCKRNGYSEGGKMQDAFNDLRANYLTKYYTSKK